MMYKGQGIHKKDGRWERPVVMGYPDNYYEFDENSWSKYEQDEDGIWRQQKGGIVQDLLKRPDIEWKGKEVIELTIQKGIVPAGSFTQSLSPVFGSETWFFIVEKPKWYAKLNKYNVEKPLLAGLSISEILEWLLKIFT